MARSKNATALFEVIHTAKKPPKASPSGGIPAPKWWSKGGKSADRHAAGPDRPADVDAEGGQHPEPSGGTRRSWVAAARRPAEVQPPEDGGVGEVGDDDAGGPKVVITRVYPPGAPDRTAREAMSHPLGGAPDPAYADEGPVFATRPTEGPAEAAEEKHAPEPPPERPSWAARRARALAERASAAADPTFDPTADVEAADLRAPRVTQWADEEQSPAPAQRERPPRRSAGPTPSAMRAANDPAVVLDRAAGEVRFRLSYGGAVAAAFILLVLFLIAYLVGQSMGQRAVADLAGDPTPAGRSTPTGSTPAGPAGSAGMMAAVSTTGPAGADRAAAQPPAEPTLASAVAPPVAALAPAPATDIAPAEPPARQVGQMYVVVQSYPDRETAQRAGDFLNRSGVPCTVIPGLSGFALRDWYSVVGLQPFARGDHRPAVQVYLRQLTALGPQFSSKAYNQFQPQLYTWRADSDAPRP